MKLSRLAWFGRLPPWLLYAITAAVCWGIWGVLAKGPCREISGWMTQVLFTIALIPSAGVACCSKELLVGSDKMRGILWGVTSGLFAGVGDLCFYLALQAGADTAIAIPLISLYPLVTLSIAYCAFRERLNRVQVAGVFVAVIAIVFLSGGVAALTDSARAMHSSKLTPWMGYTLAALVCAGVFTATQKISTNYVSAEMSYLSWCFSFVAIAICIVATRTLDWEMPLAMVGSALAAGALNGFGVIAAFAAYRQGGKAAIVAPLTAALQPIVTVGLAVLFLRERVGVLEGVGIILAILAAGALARESGQKGPAEQRH